MDKTRSVTRHYLIDDNFLQDLHHDTAGNGFIDFKELKDYGTCTSLRNWYINRGSTAVQADSRIERHAYRAKFFPTGIMIMDTANGNDVGVSMYDDAELRKLKLTLAANIVHPISVRRVYPGWTNARNIVIFGLYGNE